MRKVLLAFMAVTVAALVLAPMPASAEVEKAVINVLGGMQCSL